MAQPNPDNRRLTDIKYILKDMLKVIKVVAMYPEGNPLPQSLRRTFAEKLASIVDEYGEFRIVFEANKITFDKEIVFVDSSREESLAGLFFENGITSLTWCNPLEVLEIYKLLDVIKAYQNKAASGADFVSLLWEANFSDIKFTTVEDVSLAEYDGDFKVQEILSSGNDGPAEDRRSAYDQIFTQENTDPGNDSGGIVVELPEDVTDDEIRQLKQLDRAGAASSGPVDQNAPMPSGRELVDRLRASRKKNAAFFLVDPAALADAGASESGRLDTSTLRVAEAARAMGFGDIAKTTMQVPDTALILNDEFKLTEEEEAEIRSLLALDSRFDMFESTTELLAELLLQETELSAFFETVGICEKLIADLVAAGRLIEASHVLGHLRALEEKLEESKPMWSERLRDSRINAGSALRMKQFGETLNKHPHLSAHDIQSYLEGFGWEALASIAELLGDLEHRTHRELVCDFLSNRGKDNLAIIAKGVHDKRWFVVRNSVGILARIHDDKAIGYLAPALKHEDKRVRLEVLNAIKDRTDGRALDILRKALLDSDAAMRRTALTALLHHRGKGCFDAVSALISDPSFPNLEKDEQFEAIKAYGILGGERAVAYLRKLVTRINLFNDSLIALHRTAAFNALAHNPSQVAEAALLKLRSSWISDVRKRAKEAVALRREVMLHEAPSQFGSGDHHSQSSEVAHVR